MSNHRETNDPFDLSSRESTVEELGIPTVQSVADLEENARVLYQAAKNGQAAEALEAFAKQANWLSNIIRAALAPFYDAGFDEQESSSTDVQELASIERKMNDYRSKRNRAMVMQVECLLAEGNQDRALAMLMEVLELIELGDPSLWKRGRKLLYSIVGVDAASLR